MELFADSLGQGRARRARRTWHASTALLLLTILAFAVFSMVMAERSERAGHRATDLFQVAEVYENLEYALLQQEIARHDFLLKGGSSSRLVTAGFRVDRAWLRVESAEEVAHSDHVRQLEGPLSEYQTATSELVASQQGGSRLAAVEEGLDTAAAGITKAAKSEAAEHKAEALEALRQMQGWQSFSTRAFPILGVVCVVIVAGCVRLLTRQQGRIVRMREEAHQASVTDELTGLANRGGLREGLQHALLEESTDRPVALMLLDLDGFKMVNDTYGHDFGDEVLKVVADRLRATAPSSSLIARLGGDEFVVVLADGGNDAAERFSAAAYEVLAAPAVVQSVVVDVGASIGVAVSETTGEHAEAAASELLRRADVAMYAAKTARSGPVFFSSFLSVPAVGGRAEKVVRQSVGPTRAR